MAARRWVGALVLGLVPAWATLDVAPPSPVPDPAPVGPAIRLASDTSAPPDTGPSTVPTVAPATSPRPRVRRVRLALTGDILIHDNVWAAARSGHGFDFARLLAPARPLLARADLALCHLETPVAPAGGPYRSSPLFAAPPSIVPALAATGYDGCSTASNHTVDQGFAGVRRTLAALDRAGLAHTGSARSPEEQHRITTFDVHGLRIAWLAYSYGTNGMPVNADKPWSVDLIDPDRIVADARRARREGADAVLVALHWGDEYAPQPSTAQLELADRLTRSPAVTFVYGHHAHVVQPVRRVNGDWVAFGLGNFLAGQQGYRTGVDDGVVAEVTLTRRGDGPVRVARPRYVPTRIGPDFVVRPVHPRG